MTRPRRRVATCSARSRRPRAGSRSAWSLLICVDARLVARRRPARSSVATTYTDFLIWAALGGVAGRVRRADRRLGPLDDPPRRGGLRGAHRAAARRLASCPTAGALDLRRCSRRRPTRSCAPASTWSSTAVCRPRSSATTCWSSACSCGRSSQFASYAAFGHRRPINAVVLIGLLLVANMSLTVRDQLALPRRSSRSRPVPARPLPHLRRAGRLAAPADRRPGGDLGAVPARRHGLHRRRRHRLAAADQRRVVGAAGGRLDGRRCAASSSGRRSLERFLPASRLRPLDRRRVRADTATIRASWTTDDDPLLTVEIPPDETDALVPGGRRPTTTFDWTAGSASRAARDRASRRATLLDGHRRRRASGRAAASSRSRRSRRSSPSRPRSSSPAMPLDGRPAGDRVELIGEAATSRPRARRLSDALHGHRRSSRRERRRRPDRGPAARGGHGLPGRDRRALRPDTLADGALGPRRRRRCSTEIRRRRRPHGNPYDLADDDPRRSSSDPTGSTTTPTSRDDASCDGPVDRRVLRAIKRGYCEYYASTMAVLLRELGIPTRARRGLPARRRATADRQVARSATATRTPGSRSTSRATAGSTSTRPAATVAAARAAAVRARRSRAPTPSAVGQRGAGARRPARPSPRRSATRLRRRRPTARPAPAGPLIAVGDPARASIVAAHRRRRLAARAARAGRRPTARTAR